MSSLLDSPTIAQLRRLLRRMLTQAGTGVQRAVPLAAVTLTVTLDREEADALYGVGVTPSWLTTHRVTGRTTTGFTIGFGTAAPASATVDFLTFRQE